MEDHRKAKIINGDLENIEQLKKNLKIIEDELIKIGEQEKDPDSVARKTEADKDKMLLDEEREKVIQHFKDYRISLEEQKNYIIEQLKRDFSKPPIYIEEKQEQGAEDEAKKNG